MILRRELDGPIEAVERVVRRDMVDACAEFWFEAFARRGAPHVALADTAPELMPLHLHDDENRELDACAGFLLVGPGADGVETRLAFARSFLQTAERAVRKLRARGALRADEVCYSELHAERAGELASAAPEQFGRSVLVPAMRRAPAPLEVRPVPLDVRRLPLGPLCAAAGAEVGSAAHGAPGAYPVFYTRAARARAELLARKGADRDPPVETGGLLVGPLCSCPETGELFAVIVDVLEARYTEATTHSLAFTARTWERFQTQMRARAQEPATRAERILGQVHGHSFLPLEGAAPCDACATTEVCTRTSAFLSEADIEFCRSLFPAQPWQLSHVFGLDARGRGVEAFYGQKYGELVRRGYRLIEHFEPPLEPTDETLHREARAT